MTIDAKLSSYGIQKVNYSCPAFGGSTFEVEFSTVEKVHAFVEYIYARRLYGNNHHEFVHTGTYGNKCFFVASYSQDTNSLIDSLKDHLS